MPEGPEVAVLSNYFNKHYKDCTLKKIDILSGRYYLTEKEKKNAKSSKLIDNLDALRSELPLKITKFNCKGKFIYWELEDDWYIFLTLGLKGRISVGDKEDYNRVKFVTSCGNLYLRDKLNNGTINIYKGCERVQKKLKTLGVDLLKSNMSIKDVAKTLRDKFKKKRNQDELIGDLLLDQKYLAGVGNYIRADALYCAKISPFRKFVDITDDELETLIKCVKKIMTTSFTIQTESCKVKYFYEDVAICYIPLVYFREFTAKNEKVHNEKMKFQNRTIWYVPDVQK